MTKKAGRLAVAGMLLAVGAAGPASALGEGAGPIAPGAPVCAAATGPLRQVRESSGWAIRSLWSPPILLSSGAWAYLETARRPILHVAAVVAALPSGRVLWQKPIPFGWAATELAVLGGRLAMAISRGSQLRVWVLPPDSGGPVKIVSLPRLPRKAPAYAVLSDGSGGVVVAPSPADVPVFLSGLGGHDGPVFDLSPSVRLRWTLPSGFGAPVAAVPPTMVFARLSRGDRPALSLADVAAETGRVRWRWTLVLPALPVTAHFEAAGRVLLWAVTWRGGGRAGVIRTSTGQTVWQESARQTIWLSAGGEVFAGSPPWQLSSFLAVKSLVTGESLGRIPAGTPVAVLGGRLLLAPAGGETDWLWRGPDGRTEAAAPAGRGDFAPPYAVYCGLAGAIVLSPWQPAWAWKVGS